MNMGRTHAPSPAFTAGLLFFLPYSNRFEEYGAAGWPVPAAAYGPAQTGLLIACAVLLFSMILAWLFIDIWPLRRPVLPAQGEHPAAARFARGFAGFTGLLGGGLLSAALYSGIHFLELIPAWETLPELARIYLMAVTTLLSSITAALLVFNVFAWRHRYWALLGRLHFLLFTLAWLVLIATLYFSSVFPANF